MKDGEPSEKKGCGALVSATTLIQALPRGDKVDIKPMLLPRRATTSQIEMIMRDVVAVQKDEPWAPRLLRVVSGPQGAQLRLGVETCQSAANFYVMPSPDKDFFDLDGAHELLHVRHIARGELSISRCVCHGNRRIPSVEEMRLAFLTALDTAIMLHL